MKHGKFITFEGPDGCGKTTLSQAVHTEISKTIAAKWVSNPTHGEIGSLIRKHLGQSDYLPQTVLFLFLADRYEHAQKHILPTLRSGAWIIGDRFMDSTYVYQSLQCGISVEDLVGWVSKQNWFPIPDRTYVLALSYDKRQMRMQSRSTLSVNDRAGEIFYEQVGDRYQELAKTDSKRIVWLDANLPVTSLVQQIMRDFHNEGWLS